MAVRTESELGGVPSQDDSLLWLGPRPVPESLAMRAVLLAPDPPAIEGWLAVRRIGDAMVGERSVKQMLEYEGVSLWWFIHHWLLYGKGLSGWDERYRVLRKALNAVETAPKALVLRTRRADDDLVLKAVARTRRLDYAWSAGGWTKANARALLTQNAGLLVRLRRAKLLMRGIIARVLRRNSLAGRGPVDIAFYTTSATWDVDSGSDRLLSPVIEKANARGMTVTGIHLDYRRNLGVDTLTRLDRSVVAWESLVTPGRLLRTMRDGKRIANELGGRLPGEILGIPARDLLSDRLANLGTRLADAILALETARIFLKAVRPRCLYVVDAYDLWGLALVVAAREAGIQSVEVQHGIIQEAHSGYLHLEGEVAPDGDHRSPYSPIPDMIAVHGEAARDALIEHGRFPPSSIQITGSPNIEAARKLLGERDAIRLTLGLDRDRLAVLYFGSPLHVFPVDDRHLKAVLEAVGAMPDLQLILRPHPTDHTNPQRYQAAARAAGVKATLSTEMNALDPLLASDIVISYNSTTALDAMAMEKPVIHINMSGSPDYFRFVEDGGAVRATDESELRAALARLSSPAEREKLVQSHLPYARRFYAQRADPADEMLQIAFPPANVVPSPLRVEG